MFEAGERAFSRHYEGRAFCSCKTTHDFLRGQQRGLRTPRPAPTSRALTRVRGAALGRSGIRRTRRAFSGTNVHRSVVHKGDRDREQGSSPVSAQRSQRAPRWAECDGTCLSLLCRGGRWRAGPRWEHAACGRGTWLPHGDLSPVASTAARPAP